MLDILMDKLHDTRFLAMLFAAIAAGRPCSRWPCRCSPATTSAAA